jgi:hypothetical protein
MACGAFKLMDVNHDMSSVHAANLSFLGKGGCGETEKPEKQRL